MLYQLSYASLSVSYSLFCASRFGHLSGFFSDHDWELTHFNRVHRIAPCLNPDMGIAPKHRRTHVSHDIKHRALRDASLRQLGAERVPEVVQSTVDARGRPDALPGRL